jgi:hypothetical protein
MLAVECGNVMWLQMVRFERAVGLNWVRKKEMFRVDALLKTQRKKMMRPFRSVNIRSNSVMQKVEAGRNPVDQ